MKQILFALALATTLSARAEDRADKTISPEPPVATSSTAAPSNTATFSPKLGLSSWNDSIRESKRETDDAKTTGPGAQYFKQKNEIWAGVKHKSGWSLIGMITQYRYQYDQSRFDKWSLGDSSVRIGHPAIINNNGWVLDGQARYYFPTSDYAGQYHVNQFAYSSNLFGHIGKYEVMNILIPRYFSETNYLPFQTKFYAEDRTQVGQKLNNWLRAGVGQYTQVETHAGTPAGFTAEVYPYADVLLSKQVFLGPRVSLPVVARNTVFDSPTGVSLKNAYAELFLNATL